MGNLAILIVATILAVANCSPQYITSYNPTFARPIATAYAQPITTAITSPALAIQRAPITAISHSPITTIGHAPIAAISHAPVATISHAPIATIARPAASIAVVPKPEEIDPHPQYSFSYSVNDPTTGDVKSQSESRDGDAIQGTYSLLEPDGTTRTVDYSSDSINGFNAQVHKDGAAPIVAARPNAIIARPSIISRPIVQAPIATVSHAPIATISHAPIATIPHAPIASIPHAPIATISHAPIATISHAPITTISHAPIAAAAPIIQTSYAAPHATYAY